MSVQLAGGHATSVCFRRLHYKVSHKNDREQLIVKEAQETTGSNDAPVDKEAETSSRPDECAASGGGRKKCLLQATTLVLSSEVSSAPRRSLRHETTGGNGTALRTQEPIVCRWLVKTQAGSDVPASPRMARGKRLLGTAGALQDSSKKHKPPYPTLARENSSSGSSGQ